MERKNLEEQKLKEALAEKKPDWMLYYSLVDEEETEGVNIMSQQYWLNKIEEHFESKVGSEEDRWNELRESFKLE